MSSTAVRAVHRLLPADALTRRLAAATLVTTLGNGLFFALSTLFFTRVVGLSVAHVGIGLTAAGACGVAAGVPIGRLADLLGAKPTFTVCAVVEALALTMYPFVHSFTVFVVVVCVEQIADRGASTVRNAIIATAVPVERRAKTRAYLRAVTNVGIGVGAAFGAIALQLDTRSAYVTMALLDAATFVVSAAIMIRLPLGEPAPPAGKPVTTRGALTDVPYLVITALNGVLAMQFVILEVGLPLWVVGHTAAPRIVVAAGLLINTVLVVVLQVRAARDITTVPSAARAGVRAGGLLLLSCLLFGLADEPGAVLATVLVVLGVVVGALGEVVSSAAGWTLGYDLADPSAPGLYQGVFQTGFNLGATVAPVVITALAIGLGLGGWALLGAIFVLAGLALVPAARWAQTTRSAEAAAPG